MQYNTMQQQQYITLHTYKQSCNMALPALAVAIGGAIATGMPCGDSGTLSSSWSAAAAATFIVGRGSMILFDCLSIPIGLQLNDDVVCLQGITHDTSNTSHVTCHVTCDTWHMTFLNDMSLHFKCHTFIVCHTSYVIRHTSCHTLLDDYTFINIQLHVRIWLTNVPTTKLITYWHHLTSDIVKNILLTWQTWHIFIWHNNYDTRHMTYDIDIWHDMTYIWNMTTYDIWHMTYYIWHMTTYDDIWHMTWHDIWQTAICQYAICRQYAAYAICHMPYAICYAMPYAICRHMPIYDYAMDIWLTYVWRHIKFNMTLT